LNNWRHNPRFTAALVIVLSVAGCTSPSPQQGDLPDPNSVARHCESYGGTRTVERGPFGEIGVCVFEANRQCEEWALRLGACPRGGITVAGFATTSERHCAIRGGRMTIPGCALSPVGLYEAKVPAASGGTERYVTLVLDAGRVAMLSTAFAERSAHLVPGRWRIAKGVVTVTLEDQRLVFASEGDRLIAREWDREAWGAAGPGTLLRRR
jgi:putative hemolysin